MRTKRKLVKYLLQPRCCQSDLIFLIGTNPRYEATILNARIRKSFVNNNTKVISLKDIGNLTYPYESVDGQTKTLKDILENKHELSNILKSSKKPMIIIGESFFNLKSSKNIFYLIKDYLKSNFKFDNEWNPLNILSTDASTVGNIDLGVFNNKLGNNITLNSIWLSIQYNTYLNIHASSIDVAEQN